MPGRWTASAATSSTALSCPESFRPWAGTGALSRDAGGFYTFYREDTELGLGVELHFSGTFVGGENEDVTVV